MTSAFHSALGRPEVVAEGNTVKGNWLRHRRRYVRENHGDAAVSELEEQLEGEALRYFQNPPLAASWCPYQALIDIDLAILKGPFQGEVTRMRAFGAEIARYDLTGVYRVFLRIATPAFLASNTPRIYKTYIRDGNFTADVGKKGAKMRVYGGGHPFYMCRHGMSGFLEAAFLLAGAKELEILHPQCRHAGAEFCEWEARWA